MNTSLSRCALTILAIATLCGDRMATAMPLDFLALGGSVLGGSFAGIDADDGFDAIAPPEALPLEGIARAVSSAGDLASAFARVGPGTLATELDLTSVAGFTAADSLGSFAGDVLVAGGGVTLQVDLTSTLSLDASGALGVIELTYAVFQDRIALVEESVLLDGAHDRIDTFLHDLTPTAGSLLSLEAFLATGAEADPFSFASGRSAVRFSFLSDGDFEVSEPPGQGLMMAGLILIAAASARRRRGRGAVPRGCHAFPA